MAQGIFSRRFRALVKATGIKQKYIAHQLGVHERTVSRWATGEKAPPQKFWPKIYEVLGVTEEQFWDPNWMPHRVELVGTNVALGLKPGPYLGVQTDERFQARKCPRCGYDDFEEESRYCSNCAFPLWNFCTHPDMRERHVNAPNAIYCSHCALPTFWSLREVTLEMIRGEKWPYKNRTDEA